MSEYRDLFSQVIWERKNARITFGFKEDSRLILGKYVPMDFLPSLRARYQRDRFHFRDYEWKQGPHIISIICTSILRSEHLAESFEVAEFATRRAIWLIEWGWGGLS